MADAVLVVATKYSIQSDYVLAEIATATGSEREIRIVLAQNLTLPEHMSGHPIYDGRSRLGRAVRTLAADVRAGSGPVPSHTSRLPDSWSALSTCVGLLALSLICIAMAGCYLCAIFTPQAHLVRRAVLSTISVGYRRYDMVTCVLFLALGAIAAASAGSLLRHRWRFGFAGPVALSFLAIGVEGAVLPGVGRQMRDHPGRGTEFLSRVMDAVGHGASWVSLLGIAVLGNFVLSRTTLRHSIAGAGSSLARLTFLRSVGRTDGIWVAIAAVYGGRLPTSWVASALPDLFIESDRQLTFWITAAASDAGLERSLEEVCLGVGMKRASDRTSADRNLLLVTNSNQEVLQSPVAVGANRPILVFGCSLPIDPDTVALRSYQWIDFRRLTLDPTEMGSLSGLEPVLSLRTKLPESIRSFRVPFEVGLIVFVLRAAAGYSAAVVLSDLYRQLPGGAVGLLRILVALALVASSAWLLKAMIQRRTSGARLRRHREATTLALSMLFAALTLLDSDLYWVIRTVGTLFGVATAVGLGREWGEEGTWWPADGVAAPRLPASGPHGGLRLPYVFAAIAMGCTLIDTAAL